MTKNAYVTLVATDTYAAGALVIAHRLRDFGSTEDLVCLVTGDISPTVLEHLSQHYKVMLVDTLKSADQENLALLGRPELDITFTKLHLWSLTQYKKLVFLDADTLPLRNIDELFDRPNFSAAPDSGWPDCFNSGVFVTEPSDTDYNGLKKMVTEHGSFDGGDQGLLNRYFGSWSLSSPAHRLPFTYNTTPTTQYSYAPAHQYYVNNIAICHFIGLDKPWKYQRFSDGNVISHEWKGLTDLVQSWWDTWNLHYGQNLPHILLSRSPKDTLLISHATAPIKLFSNPTVNAWDTQNIADDIELHKHHRRLGSMPPLENITISTPKWAPHNMQASPYPESSEIHTLASSSDDKSQYSNHNSETDSFNFTSSVTDNGASILVSHDNKRITNHCENEQQNAESDQGNSIDSKIYQTIDWNPAYEVPPNTGIAADIPDLSTFVNAWDQPFQNQPVWVAPEPQPIPQMDHDYGFVHEHHQNRHHQHDNQDRESSSFADYHQHQQNIFPWEANIQQTPDPTRIWLDEQVSLAPINHHLLSPAGNDLQSSDWLKDDEKHHRELMNNNHHQNLDQQNVNHNTVKHIGISVNDNHHERHQQFEQQDRYNESHDFTEFDTAHIEKQCSEKRGEPTPPTYAMDLISPPLASPGRTPRTPPSTTADNNDQTEFDWSDRDLIPIQLKSSSKLNIDGLSPKIPSSPISSRRSSLSKSRRPSISSIKSYHRTPTAANSPVIIPSSMSTTILTQPFDYSSYNQQPMSIFAQATRSYSKKTPYTSAATTPVRERTSFLYEMEDDQNYLPIDNGHVDGNESGTHFEMNHLEDYILDYSFDEPLKSISSVHRQDLHNQQSQWDPQAALERLQHTSEFIMRQLGQQPSSPLETLAPVETVKNDASGATNPPQPQYALDTIRIEKSAQDDVVRQFNASSSSSPRTPMVQGLEDNLTAEIEAAKEQHRQQQRASLSLLQPRAAVATLLEAELDLSKSSLFNRRNDQHQKHHSNNRNDAAFLSATMTEASSSSAPINNDFVLGAHDNGNSQEDINTSHETNISSSYGSTMRSTHEVHHGSESQSANEPFIAHFDTSVMEAARRKLNVLTQNVSETSMSSTATMNEQQDNDFYPNNNSHNGSLHNLSRYSFPPTRFEYTAYRQTPTTDSAFDGEGSDLATSTSSTLHEQSQTMDSGSDDMAHLQQILDDTVDLTAENEAHRRDDDGDSNVNDQNISTWLSLTSANTIDSPQHTDDTIRSTIEGNLDDTLDNESTDRGSCDSEDEDNNIIIDTVDYIIEMNEVDTFSISETNHTHTDVKTTDTSSTTTYSPRNSGLEMGLLDTTIKDDTIPPTSSSSYSATPRPPQPPSLATRAPLSASTLSKILALKGETTKSTISASDDGDTTFLSAIEGTLTPGGSSTISSTVEWYTAGTSTPVLGDNYSNFGASDEEHETALSLLQMRTNSMAENSTDVTAPTTATATTASTKSTSNNSSFEEQQVQLDYEDAVITGSSTEYIDIYDSLSTASENTETGSN